jgi:hypothetical protein
LILTSLMSITEVWDSPVSEQYSNGWPLRRIPLLNLLRVIHLKWIGGGRVLIPSTLCPRFPCGTNKLFSGFSSDFSWLVDPLFLPFSLSYDLLLIFILNCPAASSLKFFKGKHHVYIYIYIYYTTIHIFFIFRVFLSLHVIACKFF